MVITYQGKNALRLGSAEWRDTASYQFPQAVWSALVRGGLAEREWRPDGWWVRLTVDGLLIQRELLDRDARVRCLAGCGA